MTDNGWKAGKFVVRHYRRGDLLDGEAFVLVPERDPSAIPALLAYIASTPDAALAESLRDWLSGLDGIVRQGSVPDDRIPGWVATLADNVAVGGMDIETALLRMAALVRDNHR